MKIRYTYKNYPNCPRATEYSQSSESTAAHLEMLIGPITLGAIFAIIFCTMAFFEDCDIGGFIGAVCFAIFTGLVDFFFFVCRPNNTECELNIILAEELHKEMGREQLDVYSKKMRLDNRKRNLSALKKFLIYYIPSLILIISFIGTMQEDAVSLLLLIISFFVLIFLIIKWNFPRFVLNAKTTLKNVVPHKVVEKYYSSLKYREKCYKKVADMQSYLEKGIITQEEFEKNKNDILKRIKTGTINNSQKTETTNTKKIDKEKTNSNPNEEESTKIVDTTESAPLASDDTFQEKVETVKVGKLSDEEWEYLYKTDYEKFWEMVLEEYDLSKLPDRNMRLRDGTMIYGEEARKVYLSRLRGAIEYNEWTTMNRPEVINNEWNIIKELKKELQEKTSEEVYMLDVIRNYEDKYIRY